MNLRDSRNASVAYFYFDFRDSDKQRRCNVLPSLLVQLSARSESRCDILSRLYSTHDRGVQKPSDRAMIKCLKEMLALPSHGPTYIILDALDECSNTSGIPSPRNEVLDLVNELADLRLSTLHICVTSRPEIDIQTVLERLAHHPVSLHDESGQKQDIIDYVTSVVHSDNTMRRWREDDKELVIKTLSEKADGMYVPPAPSCHLPITSHRFRWVFCQLEILSQSFPSSVRLILKELPESLDETYERILKVIRKANQDHAYRLLQCLVVAVRPLHVEELAEVLAIDFGAGGTPMLNPGWRWSDHQEAVLSACSSLVMIVEDGNSSIVQFSHFSVREFLLSNRLVEPTRDVSRYHIQLEVAHTILAQACLGVLLRLEDRIDRFSIESFPLARYAAQYWVKHAQFENVSSRIEEGMDRLFDVDRPHFAIWLWIYNEDSPRRHSRSLPSMRPSKPKAVPLYYAALHGFRDLVGRLLAKHPEDVNAYGGRSYTPLYASIEGRHFDIFVLLTDHFPEVDIRVGWGLTALHLAAWGGQVEIGKRLLARGANVNAQTVYGRTPLNMTAEWGQVEFSRMLLEHEAVVDLPDLTGRTPLHVAGMEGHVEVVRLLLEQGADPNFRNSFGYTLSEVISGDEREEEIVLLLSGYGAKSVKD